MDPKISIVVPTGGNDPLRERNFLECLKCIQKQTYKNYEIVVVEQSLDGNYYKKDILNQGLNIIRIEDSI